MFKTIVDTVVCICLVVMWLVIMAMQVVIPFAIGYWVFTLIGVL
jgi:hypothetical protein